MILGATVGGMTSEGGGAVAFPVMTLALGIQPAVARDFSLMIQSCGKSYLKNFDLDFDFYSYEFVGMTSAAFTIIWMNIKIEWHSIIFCSIGAVFGLIFGREDN